VIVLGIDPGTARLGYGLVERQGSALTMIDYGCVETTNDRPLEQRLLIIHAALTELIEAHRPEAVGVERLFFNKNVQTAMAVGQARGVVLLVAAQHGLPVFEYGPHEVKLAVTGYGRAPKDQVQRMVQLVLSMSRIPKPDDAADALAVAVCTAHAVSPQKAVSA
jgi:crossover junction endodeoxyribonuclease RuvC